MMFSLWQCCNCLLGERIIEAAALTLSHSFSNRWHALRILSSKLSWVLQASSSMFRTGPLLGVRNYPQMHAATISKLCWQRTERGWIINSISPWLHREWIHYQISLFQKSRLLFHGLIYGVRTLPKGMRNLFLKKNDKQHDHCSP